jgi:hypothetical protein
VTVELFPTRQTAKERGESGKTIELEKVRGGKRDVARVAHDINDGSFRIVRRSAQLGQLMMRLVATEIGNAIFALGRDFVFAFPPKTSHGTANQFRDEPGRPGATAFRITDHDNIFHSVTVDVTL